MTLRTLVLISLAAVSLTISAQRMPSAAKAVGRAEPVDLTAEDEPAVETRHLFTEPATAGDGAPEVTWEHLAGDNAGGGGIDGPASEARFRTPLSLRFDASGNLFVSDGTRAIRRVTPGVSVATFVGMMVGKSGYPDFPYDGQGGVGFAKPDGMAFAPNGDLFLVDAVESAIKRITPDGQVSTFAGMPFERGYVDGPRYKARFHRPHGITIDSGGNLYVADTGNYRIRKISPHGMVTTVAGNGERLVSNGVGNQVSFRWPVGIAIDSAGALLVTDYHCIRRITSDGTVSTVAGTGYRGNRDGVGSAAMFDYPADIDVAPDGNAYIADYGNASIRKMTPTYEVTTVAASAGGLGFGDCLDGPKGVAVISGPQSATYHDGKVYFSDSSANVIRSATLDGTVETIASKCVQPGFADAKGPDARFSTPLGIAADALANIYVVDSGNSVIRKVGPDGSTSVFAGQPGVRVATDGPAGTATFREPVAVAVRVDGTLLVLDKDSTAGPARLRKILPDGNVSTLATNVNADSIADDGTFTYVNRGPYKIDSSGGTSLLPCCSVEGIGITAGGSLIGFQAGYLLDFVPGATTATAIAGRGVCDWTNDGPADQVTFCSPQGVVETATSILIADTFNSAIRKLQDGLVTTIGGWSPWGPARVGIWSNFPPGSDDGTGTSAAFNAPSSIAASGQTIFVTDDHSIRVGRPAISSAATISTAAAVVGSEVSLGVTTPAQTYDWRVVQRPPGSSAQVSSRDLPNPTFTPDQPGFYAFSLRAGDGEGARISKVNLVAAASCDDTPPTVTITTPATNVCGDVAEPAWITETSGAATFRWGYRTTPGGPVTPIIWASANVFQPTIDLLGRGTRYLVATATSACGVTGISNEIPLQVNLAAPAPGYYYSTRILQDSTTTLSPNPSRTYDPAIRLTVASSTFQGSLAIDPTTGVVTVARARPTGVHTITVTQESSCSQSTYTFSLTVDPSTPRVTAVASASTVYLEWTPIPFTTQYEIWWASGGAFALLSTVQAATSPTRLSYSNLTPNTSYLYRVRALTASGWGAFGEPDVATTIAFGGPLKGQIISAQSTYELRDGANAMRRAAGLSNFAFTDPILAGKLVRAVHMQELISVIGDARARLGLPVVPLASIPAGATVRAVQFTDLQEAVE